ncbi:MAG: DUF2218 domain-containing protein [Mangrovicoccus sp.]|nr:DUF2218 domain-containing protein [Mangrovicoccus sp.]
MAQQETAQYWARAAVKTPRAAAYLQQLCKHFAHKVPVHYDEMEGRAELPGGAATLHAQGDVLHISITGQSPEGVFRAGFIVEDHLLRFAFREDLGPLEWEKSA